MQRSRTVKVRNSRKVDMPFIVDPVSFLVNFQRELKMLTRENHIEHTERT